MVMGSMKQNEWILPDADPRADSLAAALGIPVKIARILVNRKITDAEGAQSFLHGTLEDVHDPFLLQGMRTAVERLRKAASRGEKVLIFGDYDVDGVLSVVILSRALSTLGAEVDYYIPDRLEEGYGLKMSHLQIVEEKQARVVISVDCGIKAMDFVREASSKGVDVIITDHHLPGDQLPEALAVLNPVVPESGYPHKSLAGIGVVFKLIQALFQGHPRESQLPHYLKLVSIGTVADIVSLTGENRIFVKYGLQGLEGVSNLGLKSLLSVCGLEHKRVQVSDIGFRIAPRINAAGRMGRADLAVQLFFSGSEEEARRIASELNDMNRIRQGIEKKIYAQATQRIRSQSLDQRYKLLVLGCDEWHRGVIGIVASKLKEDFHRPVLLFAYDDGKAHGSGRSIREFPLIECLDHNRQYFHNYGGHPMAVGCELGIDDLPQLKQAMNAYVDNRITEEDLRRKIRIDTRLDFDEIGAAFLDHFALLSPFGVGNPKPIFTTDDVEVVAAPRRLQEQHIKLLLKHNGRYFDAVGWGKGDWIDSLSKGGRISVVYSLQVKEYLGQERLTLVLEDMRQFRTSPT
ncbi:MAG: single-stranded-DNA-specific exonuclease RecJ [Candidatus Aminicenantaceae bacterium]